MNRSVYVLLGTLLVANAAAREVDQRLDAHPEGRVSVSNVAGEIEIIGWGRKEVHVEGTIGDDVKELIFDRDGKHTWIKVKVKEHGWGHKDVAADLVIHVPTASSLDVGTVSADIDVDEVTGEQDLQAVSGDIETRVYQQDFQAETVSGDIDVTGDKKALEAELSSVSGDITVQNVSGDIDAEVVSGDVDVAYGSFERVQMETVNGDIEFNGSLQKSGKMDIESVNGSVDIDFVGSVSARIEIETFNGRIKNCFGPKAERTSKYAPGWELVFDEGGGDSRITIATLNGDVSFCKE